jgi:hypothetical protein
MPNAVHRGRAGCISSASKVDRVHNEDVKHFGVKRKIVLEKIPRQMRITMIKTLKFRMIFESGMKSIYCLNNIKRKQKNYLPVQIIFESELKTQNTRVTQYIFFVISDNNFK